VKHAEPFRKQILAIKNTMVVGLKNNFRLNMFSNSAGLYRYFTGNRKCETVKHGKGEGSNRGRKLAGEGGCKADSGWKKC
jgi:hypothetical protein